MAPPRAGEGRLLAARLHGERREAARPLEAAGPGRPPPQVLAVPDPEDPLLRARLRELFGDDIPALADLHLLLDLLEPEVADAKWMQRCFGGGEEVPGAGVLAERLADLLLEMRRAFAGEPEEERRLLLTTLEAAASPLRALLGVLPAAPTRAAAPAPGGFDPRLGAERRQASAPGAASAPSDDEVRAVFAADGPLAAAFPGYRVREAQVALARAAASAFRTGRVLVAEAGTGVGKSFAYLVPLLLACRSGGLLGVVATRTKNLQAQLYERDVPALLEALGLDVRVTLVKGRADYLCLRRLERLRRELDDSVYVDERLALLLLLRFARRSPDGDLERLPSAARERLGALGSLVARVRCEHGPGGRRCPHGARCFYPRLFRRACASHLLIANHALLLHWPRSFPTPDLVVVDEAHDLVDSATDAFGVDLPAWAIERALRRVLGSKREGGVARALAALERAGEAEVELARGFSRARAQAEALLEAVGESTRAGGDLRPRPGGRGNEVLVLDSDARERPEVRAFLERLAAMAGGLRTLASSLERLADRVPLASDGGSRRQADFRLEGEAAAEQTEAVAEGLDLVVQGPGTHVVWIEWDDERPRLRAAPVDVGGPLHAQLLEASRGLLLTSATLRVGEDFGFFRRFLGVDRLDEGRCLPPLALGSPFLYERLLDLVVPLFDGDPLAEDPELACDAIARVVEGVARALGGRTLVLFTSLDRMERTARKLEVPLESEGIRVLRPAEDVSAARVLERFRVEPRAVLLGSRSFWEGVDVPGPQVSCVVVERVPFEPPFEPVHRARTRRLGESGVAGFPAYTLPRAIVRLRQGIGRLVRSETDAGVVLLLDRRPFERRYGPLLLRSLPAPCVRRPLARVLEDVRRRFGAAPAPR